MCFVTFVCSSFSLFDLVPLDLKNAYVLRESADSSSRGRRSADFSFVSLVCAFFLVGFLCRFCPAGFLSLRQNFCFRRLGEHFVLVRARSGFHATRTRAISSTGVAVVLCSIFLLRSVSFLALLARRIFQAPFSDFVLAAAGFSLSCRRTSVLAWRGSFVPAGTSKIHSSPCFVFSLRWSA
jgi:hypothetical protein